MITNVHDRLCVHQLYGNVACDRPARTDGPHGWLCAYHDTQVVARALRQSLLLLDGESPVAGTQQDL